MYHNPFFLSGRTYVCMGAGSNNGRGYVYPGNYPGIGVQPMWHNAPVLHHRMKDASLRQENYLARRWYEDAMVNIRRVGSPNWVELSALDREGDNYAEYQNNQYMDDSQSVNYVESGEFYEEGNEQEDLTFLPSMSYCNQGGMRMEDESLDDGGVEREEEPGQIFSVFNINEGRERYSYCPRQQVMNGEEGYQEEVFNSVPRSRQRQRISAVPRAFDFVSMEDEGEYEEEDEDEAFLRRQHCMENPRYSIFRTMAERGSVGDNCSYHSHMRPSRVRDGDSHFEYGNGFVDTAFPGTDYRYTESIASEATVPSRVNTPPLSLLNPVVNNNNNNNNNNSLAASGRDSATQRTRQSRWNSSGYRLGSVQSLSNPENPFQPPRPSIVSRQDGQNNSGSINYNNNNNNNNGPQHFNVGPPPRESLRPAPRGSLPPLPPTTISPRRRQYSQQQQQQEEDEEYYELPVSESLPTQLESELSYSGNTKSNHSNNLMKTLTSTAKNVKRNLPEYVRKGREGLDSFGKKARKQIINTASNIYDESIHIKNNLSSRQNHLAEKKDKSWRSDEQETNDGMSTETSYETQENTVVYQPRFQRNTSSAQQEERTQTQREMEQEKLEKLQAMKQNEQQQQQRSQQQQQQQQVQQGQQQQQRGQQEMRRPQAPTVPRPQYGQWKSSSTTVDGVGSSTPKVEGAEKERRNGPNMPTMPQGRREANNPTNNAGSGEKGQRPSLTKGDDTLLLPPVATGTNSSYSNWNSQSRAGSYAKMPLDYQF